MNAKFILCVQVLLPTLLLIINSMIKKRITSTSLKLDVFNTDILSLANQIPDKFNFFESEIVSATLFEKCISYAITENNRKEITKLIPQYCNSIAQKHIDELIQIEYINHEKLNVPSAKAPDFYPAQGHADSWKSIYCPSRTEIDVHASSFIKYVTFPKNLKDDESGVKAKLKTKS